MSSTSNAVLTISSTDNRQRASNRFTIECSSFDILFNRQCIWCISIKCSHLTSTNNFVSASDRSKSNAVIWHQQTILPVHLMTSTSDAAVLTSYSIANAFNFIAIECSNLNINCLSSDRFEMKCNSLTSKQSSVHLMTSTSDTAFWHYTHLIIFLRHRESLINPHTYLFDQVFWKKDINYQHSIKNHLHIVSTCNYSERFQK